MLVRLILFIKISLKMKEIPWKKVLTFFIEVIKIALAVFLGVSI